MSPKNQKINKTRGVKKKSKQPIKKVQFPSNFRFITEKWFLSLILTVLIVIPSLIVAFDLGQNLKKRGEVAEKKQKLVKDLIYWQNVANTHKGYRDAYFRIALLEYQLKDRGKARIYLDKALKIDPNFEPALKLRKML